MQFNSLEFAAFLPLVVLIFLLLPARGRPLLLLIASYAFYMAWRVEYALLLVISTGVDYGCGRCMSRYPDRRRRRRFLILSLITNLGLLFTFKYYNFFRDSLLSINAVSGLGESMPLLHVLLPVGISFYTFQTLSYSIEVYRGTMPAERNLVRFALYVSFFPQLVAGPIERASHMLPQLALPYTLDIERIANGLKQIAWGLFKKIVIADRLAIVVDAVYGAPEAHTGLHIVIATVFFAYQIYCDFSGYSDVAIGTANIFGISLMDNFRIPYGATSVRDFWRRWHISLSTWFRDYLYVPLGGSRVAPSRMMLNLLIVFVVSGLWHGANLTFIFWGGLHAFYMIAGQLLAPVRAFASSAIGLGRVPRLGAWVARCTTFMLVSFAWIFFRAASIEEAWYIAGKLLSGWPSTFHAAGQCLRGNVAPAINQLNTLGLSPLWVLVSIMLIVILECVSYAESANHGRTLMVGRPLFVRWLFYIALIGAVAFFHVVSDKPFIYFQF